MARIVLPDYYAVLGVDRNATADELRRQYRRLARELHPDRAGQDATAAFQALAEAYGVLSNPSARATYDERMTEAREGPKGGFWTDAGTGPGWDVTTTRTRRASTFGPTIERLRAPLEDLVARQLASVRGNGVVDVTVLPDEVASGAALVFDVAVVITCPTCYGVASPEGVWCMRCEFAGMVPDRIEIRLPLPAALADGTFFTVPVDPGGRAPPLRVCVRIAAYVP